MKTFDIDQRKHSRHPIKASIHIKKTNDKQHALTYSIDLSEGGLCFYCNKPLVEDAKIQISIPVSKSVFRIHGRIAYSRLDERSKMYRTGVEFENAEQAFYAKLAEEILEIEEYRKEASTRKHRTVSENEAAMEWIQKNAAHFEEALHKK